MDGIDLRITAVNDEINGNMMDNQRNDQTEVHNKINTVMSSVLPTIRQPPRECDPESDLPCSCPTRRFADPPEQLPLPATRSNVPALEGWIKEYFKESARPSQTQSHIAARNLQWFH